jgi:hypothetical protein
MEESFISNRASTFTNLHSCINYGTFVVHPLLQRACPLRIDYWLFQYSNSHRCDAATTFEYKTPKNAIRTRQSLNCGQPDDLGRHSLSRLSLYPTNATARANGLHTKDRHCNPSRFRCVSLADGTAILNIKDAASSEP